MDDIFASKEKPKDDRPEYAVVINGEHGDFIVFGRGGYIESDAEVGMGAEEIGPTHLSPKERGIFIWEGHPVWRQYGGPEDDGGESEYSGHGTWRRPTDEEALKIANGDFSFFGPKRLHEERGEE